jgi:hypothetical protein
LDAAAQGAAAVRSEAKDERRSREQSLRAHQIKRLQIAEVRSSNQSDHSRPNPLAAKRWVIVSLLFYGDQRHQSVGELALSTPSVTNGGFADTSSNDKLAPHA